MIRILKLIPHLLMLKTLILSLTMLELMILLSSFLSPAPSLLTLFRVLSWRQHLHKKSFTLLLRHNNSTFLILEPKHLDTALLKRYVGLPFTLHCLKNGMRNALVQVKGMLEIM